MTLQENMSLLASQQRISKNMPAAKALSKQKQQAQGAIKLVTITKGTLLAKGLGVVSVVLLWQLLSMELSELILASPLQTLMRLIELCQRSDFWLVLATSIERLLLALSAASAIGFCLGIIAGRRAWLKDFLSPIRWLLMSVPPVIVVLLAMLWFGMGSSMVVFITVLLLSPTIYVNTQKNIEQIDIQHLELAHVYQFSWWQRLSQIYVPAIAAPLCATLIIVCCSGVRIVVLAEVLGAHQGIGYELANASSNFDTAELYAWVLVSLLLVATLELVLLRPVQNYLLRWKRAS